MLRLKWFPRDDFDRIYNRCVKLLRLKNKISEKEKELKELKELLKKL